MCNFLSSVCDNEGNLYYWDMGDSHEGIIKSNKLNDAILEKDHRKIVRLELTPKKTMFDLNIDDWELKVDEQESPKWFSTSMYKSCKKRMLPKMYRCRYG